MIKGVLTLEKVGRVASEILDSMTKISTEDKSEKMQGIAELTK